MNEDNEGLGLRPPDLSDDTFTRATKVHDWRNHVVPTIVERWASLTLAERELVHEMADWEAGAEIWE